MTLLEFLAREPVRNAWQIQDLTAWKERTRVFQQGLPDEPGFGYALQSGHPSCRTSTWLLGGDPDTAAELLKRNAPRVFVVRETEEDYAPSVADEFPSAKIYREWRMEVHADDFATVSSQARRLTLEDLGAFARFNRIPPERAGAVEPWLRGAVIFGAFEGAQLVSIASTQVRTEHVWGIAAVSTLPSHRGRGLATQVTGALTAEALRSVPTAILTVLQDNAPALRVYEKLGYQRREARVWIDHGANSSP